MNAKRKLNSRHCLLGGMIGMMLIGCKPSASVNADVEAGAAESGTGVAIVEDDLPSEESKAAILAAKDALFQRLSGALMDAMVTGGPPAAIKVCQSTAPEIAEQVSKEHGLKIGRTGVRLRNPGNVAPEWAKGLTEQKADAPLFVSLSNGHAAALLPIKLQAHCLMCHGPEDQIIPDVKAELAKLYPDDRATGFQEGELRGWFWIEMPAKS